MKIYDLLEASLPRFCVQEQKNMKIQMFFNIYLEYGAIPRIGKKQLFKNSSKCPLNLHRKDIQIMYFHQTKTVSQVYIYFFQKMK